MQDNVTIFSEKRQGTSVREAVFRMINMVYENGSTLLHKLVAGVDNRLASFCLVRDSGPY